MIHEEYYQAMIEKNAAPLSEESALGIAKP